MTKQQERYTKQDDVLKALSMAKKGSERAAILSIKQNRDLVLNSGSFVVFSNGEADLSKKTYQEQLSAIRIFQTQRIRPSDGAYDGKGTFGGMSERTSDSEFKVLHNQKITDLDLEKDVFSKDDLTLSPGAAIVKSFDLSEIARVSAARETIEEFVELTAATDIYQKLGIAQDGLRFIFEDAALIPVPLKHVHDDNYIINIWSGDLNYPVYAVSPYGHIADIDTETFDEVLALTSNNKNDDLEGREILGLDEIPLFDALKQWGKLYSDGTRDLSHDYRYPHEWMAVWRKAQMALGLCSGDGAGLGAREVMLTSLIEEVQHSIINDAEKVGKQPHKIDLIGALTEMNGGKLQDISELEKFEEDFDLPHEAFFNMQAVVDHVMTTRGYTPRKSYIKALSLKS